MFEDFLLPYLPAPTAGVAVDVGANHGHWTRWLAERYQHVFAVEPNPTLYAELNAIAANVTVLPVGAWQMPEWRQFAVYPDDQHTSAMFYNGGINTRQPTGTAQYWCQPLDHMPITRPVAFIKIDTEAAEGKVLNGAIDLLSDHPTLLIEVHTQENGSHIARELDKRHYRLSVVRHPAYAQEDPLYSMHYYLLATYRK